MVAHANLRTALHKIIEQDLGNRRPGAKAKCKGASSNIAHLHRAAIVSPAT